MLPPVAFGALRAKSMGNTIPKLAVLNSQASKVWEKLPYKEISEKRLKKLKNAVAKYQSGKAIPPEHSDVDLTWVTKNGGAYVGELVEILPNALRLKGKKGKIINAPFKNLSPLSIAYAKQIIGQSDSEETTASPAMETWIGNNGKSIQATFIALTGDQISLELKNGKTSSFPLSRLAEESQKRAKELADQ